MQVYFAPSSHLSKPFQKQYRQHISHQQRFLRQGKAIYDQYKAQIAPNRIEDQPQYAALSIMFSMRSLLSSSSVLSTLSSLKEGGRQAQTGGGLLSISSFRDCKFTRFGFFRHFSLGAAGWTRPTFDSIPLLYMIICLQQPLRSQQLDSIMKQGRQWKSMGQKMQDNMKRKRKGDREDMLASRRNCILAHQFVNDAASSLEILTKLNNSLKQPREWRYSFQLLALSRDALSEMPEFINQTISHLKSYLGLTKEEMNLAENVEKVRLLIKGIRPLAMSARISKAIIGFDIIEQLVNQMEAACLRQDYDSKMLMWETMDVIYIVSKRGREGDSLGLATNAFGEVESKIMGFVQSSSAAQRFQSTRNVVSGLWWLSRCLEKGEGMGDTALRLIKKILEGVRDLGDLPFSFVLLRLKTNVVNLLLQDYPSIVERIFAFLTADSDLMKRRAIRFMWIVSYRAESRGIKKTFGEGVMHLLVNAVQASTTTYSRRTGARVVYNLLAEKQLSTEDMTFLLGKMSLFLKKGDYYENDIGDTIWQLLKLVPKDAATDILNQGLFEVIKQFYDKDHPVYRCAELEIVN